MLRRPGVLFFERFELTGSLADLDIFTGVARQRRLLVFFPEGTFTRRAGLSGFYLGAFRVAAQAKLPVVPGILLNAIDAAWRAVVPTMEFRSVSPFMIPFKPPEPISPRWCNCATPSVPSCSGCGEPHLGERSSSPQRRDDTPTAQRSGLSERRNPSIYPLTSSSSIVSLLMGMSLAHDLRAAPGILGHGARG